MRATSSVERSIALVESIYDEYLDLTRDRLSMSSMTALNRSYPKHLLIACASSLEDQVKQFLEQLYKEAGGETLFEFVSSNVLKRGYHSLFDWDNEKAQKFFSAFGEGVAGRFRTLVKTDAGVKIQHDAFMSIGSERNRLVHRDYASYVLEATPSEVMSRFRLGTKFVQSFDSVILERELAINDTE